MIIIHAEWDTWCLLFRSVKSHSCRPFIINFIIIIFKALSYLWTWSSLPICCLVMLFTSLLLKKFHSFPSILVASWYLSLFFVWLKCLNFWIWKSTWTWAISHLTFWLTLYKVQTSPQSLLHISGMITSLLMIKLPRCLLMDANFIDKYRWHWEPTKESTTYLNASASNFFFFFGSIIC